MFDQLIQALALILMEQSFATSALKMMPTEPGKATADKEGQPVVNGSEANREPVGNVREGVALLNAQQALGDFVEAQMIQLFGELAVAFEAFDSGSSKGKGHHRSLS